ncbi:HNH endonuclease [Halobacillus litoralis]|uniref:HNH endonuclease n=1 Tax=Halobacillus litoralis TaxID=45668 RepID=UPI001CD752A2|nr:HNH endonuclease [Halobacillus litoralis]MCA1021587.1 HNH endonuclease [Halobacillus litoralis]
MENNYERYLEIKRKQNTNEVSRAIHREMSRKRIKDGRRREWESKNRDKISEYNQYRKMNKHHDITDEEWESCKKYFGYACAYCGITENESIELYGQRLHKDHFHHMGSNEIDNCIPACKVCNSSKNDHDFYEWFQRPDIFDLDKFEVIDGWLSIFE